MTLFELVKLALDELYEEGKSEYGSKVDEKIKAKLKYLSESYKTLTVEDRDPIDYGDPATRFAYVLKYVATHGDYVVQQLMTLRNLCNGQIFQGDSLRVSCIGGGPGSDLMGVIKYLSENANEPVKKLTCYLLDGEQAWADTWTEIGDAIAADYFRVSVAFQKLDVTKPDSWNNQKKFLKADLFTFSYFVSEVKEFDKDRIVGAFWTKLFDEAKVGAKFLYVDNGHDDFNNYFDAFWNDRDDIDCLYKSDNTWTTPRYSEQSDDLGEYKSKFNHNPKLKAMISTRLLKKIK
jgi:hypothetical protein